MRGWVLVYGGEQPTPTRNCLSLNFRKSDPEWKKSACLPWVVQVQIGSDWMLSGCAH